MTCCHLSFVTASNQTDCALNFSSPSSSSSSSRVGTSTDVTQYCCIRTNCTSSFSLHAPMIFSLSDFSLMSSNDYIWVTSACRSPLYIHERNHRPLQKHTQQITSHSRGYLWMTKSFPYARVSHVGADRWRPRAQLVHDSGEPTTGYTVHAGSSLRKLYSFIIIIIILLRAVATAARPAVTPASRRRWGALNAAE